jgi:hypothetical protein
LLHLANLEEIETLLLKVPPLVGSLENHDPEFITSVKAWLLAAEETLTNNRLSDASGIAAKRGMLISV